MARPSTLAAYTEATQLAPQDARGWLGLGSAHTEREDTGPARQHLQQALALAPHLAQAQGERGTLETFANRFADAESAFQAALQDHSADYVALTGLGLLRLKQGQPEAAAVRAFVASGAWWDSAAFQRLATRNPRYEVYACELPGVTRLTED